MITDIANTSQCSSIPRMFCQIRTDRPNAAPNERATVPTITSAATKLRVMINMIPKIRHSAAVAAINRSYLEPSTMSFTDAAVPVM
ncbi:Uncharacterised protein [Mycobacteroides abscessus subsp. abscessus]|nr:Uncharacterised protein [Mycobacteroides abscessus subsp. abscessus]